MSRIAREIARPMLTALVLTTVAAGPASADGCWPCYRAWYPTTQVIYDPPPLIYNRPCWGPSRAFLSARRARVIAEALFPPPPPHWRYDLRTRAITLYRR